MLLNTTQQNLDKDVIFINGLDYGTGMAYNYYYGYLRIILPATVKKLFILIPSSTYIPPDLKELSYRWMENAQELEVEIRNRAGIKNRSYRNNIYKIYPRGEKSGVKPEYIVIEGATPILTYFEVQKHFHPESAIYRKYREQIITAFYVKLKELIFNDPDCKDLCELIYYKDYDSNGVKVNVAKVILERIETLKSLEEKL
ncbi:hypothetical protein KPH14_010807 [Odynerus spinipes]|uniref:STING ligand-binding domain-containing protein n=1 Tax=Odynerus spinipes TaxID=1348599 RepID=A0AAD9VLS8_9HYME|nr:hypothetical protein KPH14_010807 [Odynerus spinipes]